ncbi:MAG TPA: LysE family transporter, partial [Paracoccaceae bacterium]|nr:LysE family transporter [Paracoccaceae bacterium]
MGGEGDLAGFALASLLSELVPGPNMGYLALVAAAEGRRAGLAAVGGVALGLAGLGLAAAFGIAALVAASPAAYGLLRWGG